MRLAEPHPTARKLLQSDRTEGIIERVRDGLLGEESIEGHLADNVRHIGDEVSNFIDKLLGEDQNQVGGVTVSNDYGPTASSTSWWVIAGIVVLGIIGVAVVVALVAGAVLFAKKKGYIGGTKPHNVPPQSGTDYVLMQDRV